MPIPAAAVAVVAPVARLVAAFVERIPTPDPETRRARVAATLTLRLARLAARQERWRAQWAARHPAPAPPHDPLAGR